MSGVLLVLRLRDAASVSALLIASSVKASCEHGRPASGARDLDLQVQQQKQQL